MMSSPHEVDHRLAYTMSQSRLGVHCQVALVTMVTSLPEKSTCAETICIGVVLDTSYRAYGRLHSIKVGERVEPKMTHPGVERAP